MRNANKINSLMGIVQGLSEKDKKDLADKIMSMLAKNTSSVTRWEEMISDSRGDKPDCPHCGAKASLGFVIKRGKCRGAQRYCCKSCSRYFVTATNTAFERTRKDSDTWRQFITYTIEGKSLAYCAENCGIAYQTAFTWRHKILNVFSVHQRDTIMNGVVQMDEMLIPVSFKGNHVKGKIGSRRVRLPGEDNGLPRKSYKRGTDNRCSCCCFISLLQKGKNSDIFICMTSHVFV